MEPIVTGYARFLQSKKKKKTSIVSAKGKQKTEKKRGRQ